MESKQTGLYEIHRSLGAKMVDFAGFKMPVQYSGILEEHIRVRTSVGVFDVSHMGEIEIRGPRSLELLNYITINDASKIKVNQAQYSAMCDDAGGIVDDLVVYNRGDHFLLVINASNIDKDYNWIINNKFPGVDVKNTSDHFTQLSIQGKDAQATLQKLTDVNLGDIKFYWFEEGALADVPMIISATGYTGEPGFEIYFSRKHSETVWEKIFEAGAQYQIAPIGLGARDSLRLEKKYCLYGNDIDQTTLPLEAGLGWITKLDKDDFIGRDSLLKAKKAGLKRRLVGFEIIGKMIPRKGYSVKKGGHNVGVVTSGAYSPILKKNIGLAYVTTDYSKVGTEIKIESRRRSAPALIVKTPFV